MDKMRSELLMPLESFTVLIIEMMVNEQCWWYLESSASFGNVLGSENG